MATKRPYSIPRGGEAIAVIVTNQGEEINVVPTREFYRLLSQWEKFLGSNGVLASIEDDTVSLVSGINQNAADIVTNQGGINTNNGSIGAINADLVIITTDISTLASDLGTLSTALTGHTTATTAHGATGNIVGDLDAATVGTKGVVNRAADPGDPLGTFANLAAVEAWAVTLRANLQAAGVMV